MNTIRLGRAAKEALLLIRKFMGKGDYHRASDAALKAAEAFKEIAKHSDGSAHKVAYKRAKTLLEITKALRQEKPLPMELVDALDSFFPTPSPSPTNEVSEPVDVENQIPQEIDTSEKAPPPAMVALDSAHHQLLDGISIACTLVEMLERANQSIRIMVQNFTDVKTVTVGAESCDVHLLDRLTLKAKEGLMIRIIISDPATFGELEGQIRGAVEKLLQQSPTIEILVCSQMHVKAILIDEAEVLEGSANFTQKGLTGIGEQATWTNNSESVSKLVLRFNQYWDHQSSECTTCKNQTCEVHPLTKC